MELGCRLRYILNPHSAANDLPNPKGDATYSVRATPSMNLQKPTHTLCHRWCHGQVLRVFATPYTRQRDLETLWVPKFRGNDGFAPAGQRADGHLPPSYIRASCNERILWSPAIATAARKPKAENANAH